jgi:hypothetical protein
MLFVPFPRVGILGAEVLPMSYFIDLLIFRQESDCENFGFPFQLFQLFFEGYQLPYSILILLIIN